MNNRGEFLVVKKDIWTGLIQLAGIIKYDRSAIYALQDILNIFGAIFANSLTVVKLARASL